MESELRGTQVHNETRMSKDLQATGTCAAANSAVTLAMGLP